MKKKYMLIAVLCVSLLTGCGTKDEKNTELSVKSENSVTTDMDKTTESTTENENIDNGESNTSSTEEAQVVQEETKEDVTESTQEEEIQETEESQQNQAVEDDSNADSQTSSDFYAVATSKSAEEVEAFAAKIRNFIISKDWNALAEELCYPFRLDGTTIENSSDFLALDLNGKLNQEFMDTMEAESCKEMFCNYQGIMMGNGEVWLADVQNSDGDFELKVFAINVLSTK